MAYVRVSLIKPRGTEVAHVHELLERLVNFYAEQPGYITGYLLDATEPDGFIGRIGVWESDKDAEHAAQQEFDLALRSQLNLAVEEHREYSFNGREPQKSGQGSQASQGGQRPSSA